MKVVFDMDTGVDDSLALIYALNRPAYEIQGIGCGYGNVEHVAHGTLAFVSRFYMDYPLQFQEWRQR